MSAVGCSARDPTALLLKPLWLEVGKPSWATLQAWPVSLGEKAGIPLQGTLLPGVGETTSVSLSVLRR